MVKKTNDQEVVVQEKSTAKREDKKKTATRLKVPANFYYGTGRRKTAIAKVWLFEGKGTIEINKKGAKEYLKREILFNKLIAPLKKLNMEKKYDVFISTLGGGSTGQAAAGTLGISRALVAMDENFKKALREEGFLTRDSRIKERKKYGKKRARKGYQFRKR